jgi:hypothetical protein
VRPTYSNVTATLALFVALGGTSYAVTQLPRNSVGSKQVRDGSLQRRDLADGLSRGPRGVEGPRGTVGPAGPTGERGPSSVRIARQTKEVVLSGVQGQPTQVRRMDAVPAGSWLLRFEGSPKLDAPTGLHVACVLKVNGDPKADTATVVGTAALAAFEASVSVDAAVTQPDAFNVTVDCTQSLDSNPAARVVRPQIIATQVGDVVATP